MVRGVVWRCGTLRMIWEGCGLVTCTGLFVGQDWPNGLV